MVDLLKHRILPVLIIAVTALTLVFTPVTPKATAAAIVPPCTNTFLEQWDWPADLRRPSGTGAGLSDFDPAKDSYVIYQYKYNATSSPKRNVFRMTRASFASNTKLYLVNDIGVPKITVGAGGTTSKSQADIYSEPRKLVPPGYYVWPSGFADVNTLPISSDSTAVSLDPSIVECVVAARNVVYDSSWTWNKFVGFVDYNEGADAATSCTSLDIACKIRSGFNAIGETFSDLTQGLLLGIADLFVPDSAQVSADFDEFNGFMSAKLGFLTYPIDFIVDVFSAFGHTGTGTCTTSGCVKSFGNLFGNNFTIDFALLAQTTPTLWAWFTGLLIGLTILELVLTIRRKYMGVIHK